MRQTQTEEGKPLSLFQSLNSRLERASPQHKTKTASRFHLFIPEESIQFWKQLNKSIKKDELSFINQTTVRLNTGRMRAQTRQLPVENSTNASCSWRRRWGQRCWGAREPPSARLALQIGQVVLSCQVENRIRPELQLTIYLSINQSINQLNRCSCRSDRYWTQHSSDWSCRRCSCFLLNHI